MVVAPYHRGTADPRATGYAEEVASDAFDKLNVIKKAPFKTYLKRKLGEWYRAAPKGPATARRAPDDDDEPPAPSAGAAVEAEDGAGTSAIPYGMPGLVNVFRPDFACKTAGILVIYDIMHS